MDKLIQELKTTLAQFSCLSTEVQEFARKIIKTDFLILNSQGEWVKCEKTCKGIFVGGCRYRLRPDYQAPEPEVVECEVSPADSTGFLGFKDGGRQRYLHTVIDDPDFIGFKYEDGKTYPFPRLYLTGNSGRIVNVTGVDFNFKEDVRVLTPTHVLFRRSK